MADFRASYTGIGEMLVAPSMIAAMYRKALKVKAAAQASAPYDPTSKDGSHFKDSFVVSGGIREGARRRACGRVSSSDPDGAFIELGTSDTPAHHTLARALDAARE